MYEIYRLMAVSFSRLRFVPLLFTFLLNIYFASALERLQTPRNGVVSLAKRATGKTFEIPFDVIVSISSKVLAVNG